MELGWGGCGPPDHDLATFWSATAQLRACNLLVPGPERGQGITGVGRVPLACWGKSLWAQEGRWARAQEGRWAWAHKTGIAAV